MKKQLLFAWVAGPVAFNSDPSFLDYKRYLAWAPVLYVGEPPALLADDRHRRSSQGATSWIQVGASRSSLPR